MASTRDRRARRGVKRAPLLALLGLATVASGFGCAGPDDSGADVPSEPAVLTKAEPGDKAFAGPLPTATAAGAKSAPLPGPEASVAPMSGAKSRHQIEIGSVASGELVAEDAGDIPLPVDWWTFELPSAGELTLIVGSEEINPMVKLFRGEEEVQEYMGDHAVQLIFDAEGGAYSLAVLGLAEGLAEYMGYDAAPNVGTYEIGVDFRKASDGNHTATLSMLHPGMSNTIRALGEAVDVDLASAGERNSGELRDGSYFEDYPLELAAGEAVTVTMRSVEFDTYLLVLRDEEILASNDDWGEGTDSRITFTAPSAGTYVFRANSYEAGATGMFSLIVDR